MSAQGKADKPQPDHRKYLVVQFVMKLIRVVVVVAFLAWIVFGLFGPALRLRKKRRRAFGPIVLGPEGTA